VRVLAIVPTYNERDNLPILVRALRERVPGIELLVIDDASPDGTGEVAEELAHETGAVAVQHRPGKLGLGSAYVGGFQYAIARRYDRVIQMDADLSHRPADVPALLAATEAADVAIGSRNIPGGRTPGWPAERRLISRFGSLYARTLLSLPVQDCTSGFKCFRGAALEMIELDRLRSNGYAFQVEVNYACARAGLRLTEVPIVFPERVNGVSKMSGGIAWEAARLVLQLRRGATPAQPRREAVEVAPVRREAHA